MAVLAQIYEILKTRKCGSKGEMIKYEPKKENVFSEFSCILLVGWFGLVVWALDSEIQWWDIPFFRDTVL